MSNELVWTKVKEQDETRYVSGSFQIDAVIGSGYWKWILVGVTGFTQYTFRTLRDAKEHAQRVQSGGKP